MSEATLTATVTAEPADVQAGALVQFSPDGDRPQLALVADAADGSGTVQVITPCCPDDDDLITRAAARGSLMAPPDELDTAQCALAQRLTVRLAWPATAPRRFRPASLGCGSRLTPRTGRSTRCGPTPSASTSTARSAARG